LKIAATVFADLQVHLDALAKLLGEFAVEVSGQQFPDVRCGVVVAIRHIS
jgi:hypothetical protein